MMASTVFVHLLTLGLVSVTANFGKTWIGMHFYHLSQSFTRKAAFDKEKTRESLGHFPFYVIFFPIFFYFFQVFGFLVLFFSYPYFFCLSVCLSVYLPATVKMEKNCVNPFVLPCVILHVPLVGLSTPLGVPLSLLILWHFLILTFNFVHPTLYNIHTCILVNAFN